jgi:hypothetical protein
VLFLVIAYFFSFVTFLLFGVSQHRIYQRLDATEKTMKDFALELTGLPELKGLPGVEKDIQKAAEAATGKTLVGVSVAWNYQDQEESIMGECTKELSAREAVVTGVQPVTDEADPTENMGAIHKWMYNQD